MNLLRKHLKVFASGASNNGVFGSAADNTKILTNDIEALQSKPAWLTGWWNAVIGTRKFPTLEEMQTLTYVLSYQMAYLLQKGIPEYYNLDTYYQNSIVREGGTYKLYGSLTDNNQGNPLTDELNWKFLVDLNAQNIVIPNASTSERGIAMLATVSDVVSGNNDKIVTPDLLKTYGFQTGDWKGATLSTLQPGWIWAAGTIGNTGSNATNRANPDTFDLFSAYWNDPAYNYVGSVASGAALQVYSSAGAAVSKGSSALADWNAGRTIAVPDFRDRVAAGRGNMVGNAGRLSGQTNGVNGNGLGNSGGRETHTMTGAQNGPHVHSGPTVGAYNVFANFSSSPSTLSTPGQSGHSSYALPSTGSSGGGEPHNNVQPTIITNIIIKL